MEALCFPGCHNSYEYFATEGLLQRMTSLDYLQSGLKSGCEGLSQDSARKRISAKESQPHARSRELQSNWLSEILNGS